MIKKLLTALCTDNKDILYLNEDFGNVVFNCNGMSILNINLDNINLANSFDEDDPDTWYSDTPDYFYPTFDLGY